MNPCCSRCGRPRERQRIVAGARNWWCDPCTATADAAYNAARTHARRCRQCCYPILDEEGNPGLFGEACRTGLRLLIAYCDATGERVPPTYRKEVTQP